MARLRRRHLPQEPIRRAEAVVVARCEPVDRADEEVTRGADTQAQTRSGVLPAPIAQIASPGHGAAERSVPPVVTSGDGRPPSADARETATPEPVLEPAAAEKPLHPAAPEEKPLLSSGLDDKHEQQWFEEGVAAEIPPPAPDHGAAAHKAGEHKHTARAIPAHRSDYDAPSEDEDDDYLLPATVDTATCAIAVWRGYRKAAFYAQAFDSRGEEVALSESPLFRWRGNGMPEQTEAAAKAHRALLDLLRQSGWEPTGYGTSWFDVTLTRR
jgi:hypothetical protein